MTTEHKAAMEIGRAEGRVVREYLEALRSSKPKRGRKRTPDSIQRRLTTIENELESATAIEELKLVQERSDLNAELQTLTTATDIEDLEEEFTKVAASYGERKGITYMSWRQVGVSASVLKRSSISRAT